MERILLIFFICFTSLQVLKAQTEVIFKNDSVKKYIDKTFLIIHDNALKKNEINWDSLKRDIYEEAKNADNIEEILPLYSYIFEKMKDHHGWLSYKGETYRWAKNSKRERNEVIKKAQIESLVSGKK